MPSRLDLQKILEGILGSRNVYYQPPPNISMKYPAIVYSKSGIENVFADNEVYAQNNSYDVTILDMDPDSKIIDSVSKLPTCRFNRAFASDNLNHTIFTIIY